MNVAQEAPLTEYAELLERLKSPLSWMYPVASDEDIARYRAGGDLLAVRERDFYRVFMAAHEAADAIATLLARAEKAEKPRVKPLEWTEVAGYFECREWDYRVTKAPNGMFGLSPIEWPAFDYPFASAEEAKAVAQADYEDRIRSALEPSS